MDLTIAVEEEIKRNKQGELEVLHAGGRATPDPKTLPGARGIVRETKQGESSQAYTGAVRSTD